MAVLTGEAAKLMGGSSKLAYTRWMEQVCVCACLSIYISILGMYSLYICMPHMYVHVFIHIHIVQRFTKPNYICMKFRVMITLKK